MTSEAQYPSNKIAFNMDWSFGGIQLEKVLLEELIQGANGRGFELKKVTFVVLASSVTSAYHKAGAPAQNVLAWQQVKGKVFAVSHISRNPHNTLYKTDYCT